VSASFAAADTAGIINAAKETPQYANLIIAPLLKVGRLLLRLGKYCNALALAKWCAGDRTVQANVRNIFNARYFPAASLTRATPGEPRTFMISLDRRF
jgi:hypothetical protein